MSRVTLLGAVLVFASACSATGEDVGPALAEEAFTSEALARAAQVEQSLGPTILIEGEQAEYSPLADRMALHTVPGVSIAVLKDGALDWARAYGVADVSTGRLVTPTTIFQAASISKPLSAMAALRLVQDGRISLDEDVNNYFRSWTLPTSNFVVDRPVTLRGLLTHTAGLGVSGFPGYAAGVPIPSPVEVLDGTGATNTDAVRSFAEPGAEWSYSGGGYTAMQVLIEDVTGEPFAEYLKSTVLEPIGMDRSFFAMELGGEWVDQAAFGHRPNGSQVEGRWNRYPELAAAGLWTTPMDLLAWGVEVLTSAEGTSNHVLSPEMTRAMLEQGMGDWGLGPEISPDGTRFLHTGSNQGYRCLVAISMDGSVGVAVMTNSDNGGVLMSEIAHAVARVYGWEGEGLEPEVRQVIAADPTAIQEFVGRYPAPGDREVVVTLDEGQLTVASEWFQRQPAFAESDDTFFLLHGGTRLRFEREDGQVVLYLYGMRLERSAGA